MVDHEKNGSKAEEKNWEQEYSRLSERERTLPSGFVVRFRKLGIGEWVGIWKAVPSLIKAGVLDQNVEEVGEDVIAKSQQCVIAASISPRFVDLPAGKTAPGFMSVRMLSDADLADFVKGLTEAMGFGTKRSEVAADVVNA